MSTREELLELVGSESFTDDPEVLEAYSTDFGLVPPGAPNYVVKPRKTEEVHNVIEFANEHSIPVVPVSSQAHFYGTTIPKQGGIVLDLTGMNKVLEIDELNKRVRIEVGVTWEQLTSELEKKGFRIVMPLLPHPLRSVVTDYLEREVITNTTTASRSRVWR
jgi:glycolate oxidase